MLVSLKYLPTFFFLVLPLYCDHPPSTLMQHAQSCNPMDFSLPGSSVHGLFQARILEWVAISFSAYPLSNSPLYQKESGLRPRCLAGKSMDYII